MESHIPAKEVGNKSTYELIASRTPGEYEIIFKARYLFLGPDKEGNVYKDISTTKTYTIEACDAINSFWGDHIAETMINCPILEKSDDNTYVGMLPDLLSMDHINPPLIPTKYIFTDGKLSQILESEVEDSAPVDISRKYMFLRIKIKRLLGVDPVSDIITWTDPSKSETFDLKGDDAYKEIIGQGVKDHKAEIVSIFRGTKTDIKLTVSGGTGVNINYIRNYQKAGTLK